MAVGIGELANAMDLWSSRQSASGPPLAAV
jgi:hypothetical protein